MKYLFDIITFLENEIKECQEGMIDRFIANIGREPTEEEKTEIFYNTSTDAEFYEKYDDIAINSENYDKGYLFSLRYTLNFIRKLQNDKINDTKRPRH